MAIKHISQQTSIALAIALGFTLVAAAIYFGNSPLSVGAKTFKAEVTSPSRETNQRIFGEVSASLTIVEFSDVECPFCARLHPVLEQIVLQSEGQVRWEYRHLPLPSHRNAELGAIATECVAELTDDTTFWSYLDALLKGQGQHNEAFYTSTAVEFGVDVAAFTACLDDPDIRQIVVADMNAARQFGGRGTPFSVIEYPDGRTQAVSGALPFAQWQVLIDNQ